MPRPDGSDPCPFCARLVVVGGGATREHVFGRRFGSRFTVDACKECNDRIGYEVEGRLHEAGTFAALLAATAGSANLRTPGTTVEGGEAIEMDWTGMVFRPRAPRVSRVDEPGARVRYEIFGSPEQTENVLRDLRRSYGDQVPLRRELSAGQVGEVWPGPMLVEMDVALDLPVAHRYAAKVALGAGRPVYGAAFAGSALAARLQAVLFDPDGLFDPEAERVRVEALDVLLGALAGSLPADEPLPALAVTPPGPGGPRVFQVLFAPHAARPEEATVVFVHALSALIPPYGIVVDAPVPQSALPGGMGMMRALREERGGRWEVHRIDEVVLGYFAKCRARRGPGRQRVGSCRAGTPGPEPQRGLSTWHQRASCPQRGRPPLA